MERPKVKDYMITDPKVVDVIGSDIPDLLKYSEDNKKYIDYLESLHQKTYPSLDGITKLEEPNENTILVSKQDSHLGELARKYISNYNQAERYTTDQFIENKDKRIKHLEAEDRAWKSMYGRLSDEAETANEKIKEQGEVIIRSMKYLNGEIGENLKDSELLEKLTKLLSQPKTTNPK